MCLCLTIKSLQVYNRLKPDILNIPDISVERASASAAFYSAAANESWIEHRACGQDMKPSLKLNQFFVSVS